MSLILKGIDMPKDCDDCMFNFYREGDSCPACYLTKHIVIRKKKESIPTDCPLIEIVTCGECIHFHYDKPYIIQGIPVLGHEVCDFWGDGCKTNPNGFCSHGERREDL